MKKYSIYIIMLLLVYSCSNKKEKEVAEPAKPIEKPLNKKNLLQKQAERMGMKDSFSSFEEINQQIDTLISIKEQNEKKEIQK